MTQPMPQPTAPSASPSNGAEARHAPRLRLPAMYTLVRVKPIDAKRYRWIGHVYDVSATGMRFEIDYPVRPGSEVAVRVMLPGHGGLAFEASGRVVRLHDDDALPGPQRMGMHFERFASEGDRSKLTRYLTASGLRLAA